MKIVKNILLIFLAGIAGFLVIACLIYPSEYVFRILRWGNADVYDYKKFPNRPLSASSTPFHFAEDSQEEQVRTLFESTSNIDDFDAFLADKGTQAFIVIQNDTILYEEYFNGAQRDSIVTSFSIAKSFTSALIGIAIDEGYISSVNEPIVKYLPELSHRDPRFNKITIRHLLMMSSGIKYVEFPFLNGDDAKTYYYPNLRQLALEQTDLIAEPGQTWLYNNYHPLLLGLIIERATGKTVTAYLQEKIWEPIGMEFDGSWSMDSEASGFEKMESGINAHAIDFAKFGRLYLNIGNWEGNQIIPSEWVVESTQPLTNIDNTSFFPTNHIFASGNGYYTYMWWGMRRGENNYAFYALGNYGQFIYISPSQKLIVVRNGERYGIEAAQWIDMFYKFADAETPR